MDLTCYHCGENLDARPLLFQGKKFCCAGCKSVFQILSDNQLDEFYTLESKAGIKPEFIQNDKYSFLDLEEIKLRFVKFEDDNCLNVVLNLPSIHCSSCIYLLENLHKIENKILKSQVHFSKKEASITFLKSEYQLSDLATLLDKLGYSPNFQQNNKTKAPNRTFLIRIGIAGFAFGSIMLWSFPEYTGIKHENIGFRDFTSWLSFAVSIPVLLISAREYYLSAFKAIRNAYINLDVPISIGIAALYAQSVFSILNHEGPGYMDSFSGFIFFLLIGKWFQNRTYQSLSFDRDYTSYFPVAVRVIHQNSEQILPIEKIEIGNIIRIRNQEIIPCDAQLMNEEAIVDYSFVTGESHLIYKKQGDFVYAGGKVMGNAVNLEVQKKTDRSHLTQLWNESLYEKNNSKKVAYQDRISALFLYIVLSIAFLSAIVWAFLDTQLIIKVVVSVLIVACPCALALSTPFTYGNAMRKMGHLGCFLKNTSVVESMENITSIVFDKTGTLTDPKQIEIISSGKDLNKLEMSILYEMTGSSTHPLSSSLHKIIDNSEIIAIHFKNYEEHLGKGIEVAIDQDNYKLGNSFFTEQGDHTNNNLFFTKNGILIQQFLFTNHFRKDLAHVISKLRNLKIYVLSGDSETELPILINLGITKENILFHQSSQDKHDFIKELQRNGERVLMIGDGLNDGSALAQADVGMAISEDMFKFTPASDAILDAKYLNNLYHLLDIASFSKKVLRICLTFSIIYNFTGILIAVSGLLSPLIAAILMPLSSITIVFLSTSLIYIKYRSVKN